jgi:hypothetical protein
MPDRSERNDRLTPLTALPDYKLAAGTPDVRGWEVFGADGRRIGEVNDLLVDVDAGRVEYLDVRLDRSLRPAEVARASAVPGDAEAAEAAEREAELEAVERLQDEANTPIPELDSLSRMGGVAGIAAVPGAVVTPGMIAANLKERLIRETLSDAENVLTAAHHLDHHHHSGERYVLLPLEPAQLENGRIVIPTLRAEEIAREPVPSVR